MAEVRELADRVTVLRDGRLRGTSRVADISDEELLALILGRQLDSTFPPKHEPGADEAEPAASTDLAGPGLHRGLRVRPARARSSGSPASSATARASLLRALAGLDPFTGTVRVGGRELSARDLLHRAAYMPSDRHARGAA